jgi:predicted DNA-binding transcriptional regulator YafY
MIQETKSVVIVYTNWKGETGLRTITPKLMFWGSTQYHPVLQWLLLAFDEDKKEERTFALKDILSWKPDGT